MRMMLYMLAFAMVATTTLTGCASDTIPSYDAATTGEPDENPKRWQHRGQDPWDRNNGGN